MQRPQASEALSEEEIAQAYLFSLYKTEPDFFVEHGLGHVTWGKQREILQSVRDHKKTAVKACHGASKTFTAAEVAVWFLNVFPKSKVITTAPTYPQVEMLLWAEINEIYSHSRIQLEGECLMTKIKTEDNTHYAVGFSTDKPARAEGWHSPAMLFIFDEAKGIPAWLYDSARALMTGGFCRWLVISTTDGVEVGEPFYEIFNNDDNDWNKISVSAEDTPYCTGEKFRGLDVDENNLCKFTRTWIDPKDIVIQIATPEYIDECRVDWGEDSPLFQTKVLGMLSDVGADTIIKLSQINKMWANADNSKFDDSGAVEIGVDVARGGEDDTVFFKRKGLKITDKKVIRSKDLPPTAKLAHISDLLCEFAAYDKTIRIKVDDTGLGGGVTDIMQRKGYKIVPINFAEKASEVNEDRYPDIISEMWYEVAPYIHEISCPKDTRLEKELANRKGGLDKKGKRKVESKEEYKKRGSKTGGQKSAFRSPDYADAFLLCLFTPRRKEAAFLQSKEPIRGRR